MRYVPIDVWSARVDKLLKRAVGVTMADLTYIPYGLLFKKGVPRPPKQCVTIIANLIMAGMVTRRRPRPSKRRRR
jgi:hypothetical protein